MVTTSRTTPTARKSAAKPKVEDAPTFHFSIKQAEAEREEEIAEEPIAPFTVESLKGETIVFRDARLLGWQELSLVQQMRDPHVAVRTILLDEYVDAFYDQGDFGIPTLTHLLRGWMDHYGVTPQGN